MSVEPLNPYMGMLSQRLYTGRSEGTQEKEQLMVKRGVEDWPACLIARMTTIALPRPWPPALSRFQFLIDRSLAVTALHLFTCTRHRLFSRKQILVYTSSLASLRQHKQAPSCLQPTARIFVASAFVSSLARPTKSKTTTSEPRLRVSEAHVIRPVDVLKFLFRWSFIMGQTLSEPVVEKVEHYPSTQSCL